MDTPSLAPSLALDANKIIEPSARTRLMLVAMQQIAELGFKGVTVRGIAAAANVSPGLIKHHFASKEGLRDAVDAHFLQRSKGAFERIATRTKGTDLAGFAEYEHEWLTRYADEWPHFTAYMRRAIMEQNPWGKKLVRNYYDSLRTLFDRYDVQGRIRSDADRVWIPLIYMFLIMGPLVMDGHIKDMLGRSPYEPEIWERFLKTVDMMMWQGIGNPSQSGGVPQ